MLKTELSLLSSHRGAAEMNPTGNHEVVGSIPGLTQWVKNLAFCHELWYTWRLSSDPALLWLWCRLAAAAWIGPLAWELPYAAGMALKREKQKQKQTNKQTNKNSIKAGTESGEKMYQLLCLPSLHLLLVPLIG